MKHDTIKTSPPFIRDFWRTSYRTFRCMNRENPESAMNLSAKQGTTDNQGATVVCALQISVR